MYFGKAVKSNNQAEAKALEEAVNYVLEVVEAG